MPKIPDNSNLHDGQNTKDPTEISSQSRDENRIRSVGELKQALGVTDVSQVRIAEMPPPEVTDTLEVHQHTKDNLNWKPEFYAMSDSMAISLRVSRAESEALLAAGAKVAQDPRRKPVRA